MSTPAGQDWQRLADLLIARRIELGHAKRLPFAKQNGLTHDRTLSDLENGRRTRFDAATLAQVEQLYRWAPGSIREVLAGGEPTKLAGETAADQDDVLALLAPGALDGLPLAAREEIRAVGEAAMLARARQIRREMES